MSLPIIDINAGDTVSAMVDKINYNFTLVSLKGGGPSGIQGIQGIRGQQGDPGDQGEAGTNAMIYSEQNPPATAQEGDINIWDGCIYRFASGQWVLVVDLNQSVDSPFGLGANGQTINPKTEFVTNPVIFGVGTTQQSSVPSNNSALHIHTDNSTRSVSFYSANALKCSMGIVSTGFEILAENGGRIDIVGSPNSSGGYGNIITVSQNGIYFPSRIAMLPTSTDVYKNTYVLMASSNFNGQMTTASGLSHPAKKWAINAGGDAMGELFGYNDYTFTKNIIGIHKSDRNDAHIDEINMGIKPEIRINGEFDVSDYGHILDSSLRFKAVSGTTESNVMWVARDGIVLGDLTDDGTPGNLLEPDVFTVRVEPSSYNLGLRLSLSSKTNKTNPLVSASGITVVSSGGSSGGGLSPSWHSSLVSPDWKIRGEMYFTGGVGIDMFMWNKYSTMLNSVKFNMNNTLKTANDSLHVHGSDSTNGAGNDVVITGGNSVGTNTFEGVGGDVYISGGGSIRKSGSSMQTDLKRSGNVIIGINPYYHEGCLYPDNYNATKVKGHNSDNNPDGVGFFDTNNISMHGNRIVIDSNANFRKATESYTRDLSGNVFTACPYVEEPEKATVSISGINTMMHTSPVCIDKTDICSHQFMSGVMRRITRFRISEGSVQRTFVNPDNFDDDAYFGGDDVGSVYFITDQVWQKIGNVVNVNAFGRWVANNKNHSQDGLFHVTDYMFYGNTGNSQEGSDFCGYWGSGSDADNWCFNKTLANFLIKVTNNEKKYKSLLDGMGGQPMTMFALPFTVDGMEVSHCYGNGNIYTENPKIYKYWKNKKEWIRSDMVWREEDTDKESRTPTSPDGYFPNNIGTYVTTNWIGNGWVEKKEVECEPTGSVLMSTPVVVGTYYPKNTSDSVYDYNSCGSDVNNNDNKGGWGSTHTDFRSSWGVRDLASAGMLQTSERITGPSNETHVWNENRFLKTEVFESTGKYPCYIYPEMLASGGNYSKGGTEFLWQGKYMRPCIGMYTWISLNYSYCLMNDFNLSFGGFSYSGVTRPTVSPRIERLNGSDYQQSISDNVEPSDR